VVVDVWSCGAERNTLSVLEDAPNKEGVITPSRLRVISP